MKTITDKTQFTDAYHLTMTAIERFSTLSVNIPKIMHEVVRHIYGRFDDAAYHLHRAANTYDQKEKLEHLEEAQANLFFQYSSLELLVKTRSVTVGAATEVIVALRNAHDSTAKWLTSVRKLNGEGSGATAAGIQ